MITHKIGSVKELENYIISVTAKDIIVIKKPKYFNVIWALNNELKTFEIPCKSVFNITDTQLWDAIDEILETSNK